MSNNITDMNLITSKTLIALMLFLFTSLGCMAQRGNLSAQVFSNGKVIPGILLELKKYPVKKFTDSLGQINFLQIPAGQYELESSGSGYVRQSRQVEVFADSLVRISIDLDTVATDTKADADDLDEIVITGTMKAVHKLQSPIPVEVYSPSFFRRNPSPSIFEAIGQINGVRPQINCSICNTGDIHINGMEGPYTLILIDGMPIVSSLSSVYGLSGIPNSLVERIEVVKGPASSLYGSEAMGGVINVITKNPQKAPLFSIDAFSTSWREYNLDAGLRFKGKKWNSLLGLNYFNAQHPMDENGDGFTDLTMQHRISLFNKWNFSRKEGRVASIAGRFVNEDRWGGQMEWTKADRGSNVVYGESIYTRRWELLGLYQLPFKEKLMLQFSYNQHDQNSYYGETPYMAFQKNYFTQLYWNKDLGRNHSLLLGGTFRYNWYNDNTPATAGTDGITDLPAKTPLPGIFIQDEWKISAKHTLLGGYRYDYDRIHGSIHSPRLAYQYTKNPRNILRFSLGTGFRVVNLFTEDHAALTGAREVVITEALLPERSYNANLNYVWKIPASFGLLNIDATGFYSYFTNKIIGDFDQDPRKIIYSNLNGYAISRGFSMNTELAFNSGLNLTAGLTYADVYTRNQTGQQEQGDADHSRVRQIHAPLWSGTYGLSYTFAKAFKVDLTGVFTGPMRLPIQPDDYRPEYSPWFTIANIQLSKQFNNGLSIYGGIKNLLNFVPKEVLMRPFDPFNQTVNDPVNNPKGYTFDTSYNYAPLQGFRVFAGLRYQLDWK